MGITRSRLEKKKVSGGKTNICRKRRKHESGRIPANTKLGGRRCAVVRTRGGNMKLRGLRLSEGNFSWGTEAIARSSRILDVVYNATSNELVRTKTLVKNCIVTIDAMPFKAWYARHYGIDYDTKRGKGAKGKPEKAARKEGAAPAKEASKKKNSKGATADTKVAHFDVHKASSMLQRKWAHRAKTHKIEKAIEDQLKKGHLLCRITSRPGQTGRADGALLEGAELQFYLKKVEKRK